MGLASDLPTIHRIGVVDVQLGKNVTIVEPVNLYGCKIGSDTFIGPFVEIQRGVSVGDRCRIQSHVFICDMVTISDDCFISHGAKFVNDRFSSGGPARGDRSRYSRTYLGRNVSIGTNATILPVSICDNVVIGAGAVLTKDVTVPGLYAGNPAEILGQPRAPLRVQKRVQETKAGEE